MLKNDIKYILWAVILLFFASIKVIADVFWLGQISALAAATNVSPAMKVFTAHKGYETYSSTYVLKVAYADNSTDIITLDPKVYSQLKWPYNRRNIYGAAVAYWPILQTNEKTVKMWESIVKNTFCEQRSSAAFELGFDKDKSVKEVVVSYKNTKDSQWFPEELHINCN